MLGLMHNEAVKMNFDEFDDDLNRDTNMLSFIV